MKQDIHIISLFMPFKVANVNCYLIHTDESYYLVDTGMTSNRRVLEAELIRLGCQPGMLKLILLTHGDFDHTGNAVYLRNRYGGKIGMHRGDAGMLEGGDMFYNRKFDNRLLRGLLKAFLPFKAENRGKPELLLEDGTSLGEYGLDATVLNTPGHSSGSLCYLTPEGDLFCGDLLTSSRGRPELNTMLYDHPAGLASLERLRSLSIRMVYPGHGNPFRWEELVN